jgi:hypothetical protein
MLEEMFVQRFRYCKVSLTRYLFLLHYPLLEQNGRAHWVEDPLYTKAEVAKEGANKQGNSSQADS